MTREFVLSTARLELSPITDADVAALVRHWGHAQVRHYLWDDRPVTYEMVNAVVTTSNLDFKSSGYGVWAVRLRDEEALIGMVGLRRVREAPQVELLYSLRPRYWRRGLATEAVRAVVKYAFVDLGLEEVIAGHDPVNVASSQVLRRLGMGPWRPAESLAAKYWRITRERFSQHVAWLDQPTGATSES